MNEWRTLVIDGYNRIPVEVTAVLKRLSVADLEWQPRPRANSIGWTVWHLMRLEDCQIAELAGSEQVWIMDGWHKKFGRPRDPEDTGYGHTPGQVKGFKSPRPKIYLDYLRAVTRQTKRYLLSLKPSDLKRKLNEPWYTPVPTVAVRIVSVLADCHQHLGEASYVRGLLKRH
ncbi:MAG: DinB family protein [Candidatus Sungbacteria bacterium]|nr:DinB family protein [Candidatus Sungbacteria bacterium]